MILPKTYGFPKPMKQYNFMGCEKKIIGFNKPMIQISWGFHGDFITTVHMHCM